MNREELEKLLTRHEGKRRKPYLDCCGKSWRDCTCQKKGKLTIGIGRNLDDVGLFEDEIDLLFDNDIDRHIYDLNYHLPWWSQLNEIRQMVMVDMCFCLGIFGLLGFKKMLPAAKAGDYSEASIQIVESELPTQRAFELSEMMRMGK